MTGILLALKLLCAGYGVPVAPRTERAASKPTFSVSVPESQSHDEIKTLAIILTCALDRRRREFCFPYRLRPPDLWSLALSCRCTSTDPPQPS